MHNCAVGVHARVSARHCAVLAEYGLLAEYMLPCTAISLVMWPISKLAVLAAVPLYVTACTALADTGGKAPQVPSGGKVLKLAATQFHLLVNVNSIMIAAVN